MKYISEIKAEIESISPLYISDGEDILLDEMGMAYIPATTVVGAFRGYLDCIGKDSDKLFGDGGKNSRRSSIYIKDSFADNMGFEERIGIRIDGKMGSALDGAKMDNLYLAKGLKFELNFKIENKKEDILKDKDLIYKCLNALDHSLIRIGGSKSSGLGVFKVKKIQEINFDFSDKNQWIDYIRDDYSNIIDITESVLNEGDYTGFVRFHIKGEFTTPLLVGSPESYDPNAVDSTSIISGDEYIVPGSSFKGTLRSRIEKIGNYFGNLDIAREIFGDKGTEGNAMSRLLVTESIIDTSNFQGQNYNRINIDKFTGGVRKTGLMKDAPIQGRTEYKVLYKKQGNKVLDEYAIGIISLALRDLGNEDLTIGGGYSIARGRFKADSLSIIEESQKIEIDFLQKTISNNENLDRYINSVKRFNEEVDHG